MFESAPGASYDNLPLINTTLLAVVFGTVRYVFERSLSPKMEADVRQQLVTMCLGYLDAAKAAP